MSDNIEKQYNLLYEDIRETNKLNAKYRELSRVYFNNQAEDDIDHINLILDLKSIKKDMGAFKDALAVRDEESFHEDSQLHVLNEDLLAYQEAIIEVSGHLSAIILKTRSKLNGMGRYSHIDFKKDIEHLKDVDDRRIELERALTDICVTFRNRYLYKPKKYT